MYAWFGNRVVIAGILLVAAGLILAQVANRHQGEPALYGSNAKVIACAVPGWSHTTYDAAAVIAWLLILIGVVWVITGLVRYRNSQRTGTRR
jgi:hypothetical protein